MPPREYLFARISPDGTQAALDIRDKENGISTWDFGRKTLTRLTFDPGLNRGAVWSPDGLRLAFTRPLEGSEHAYWQSANGTGMPELLADGPAPDIPTSFSPDGTKLLFDTLNDGHPEIGIIDIKSHKREMLMKTTFSKRGAEFSPDGRWIVYASNESGSAPGIYVRPFPNVNGGRWQVGSGAGPTWSRNGKEIFFRAPGTTATNALFSVPVQAAAGFSVVGNPQPLFEGDYTPGRSYDVSPDGTRFLMIKRTRQQNATPSSAAIVVVLNWFRELQERAPLK